MAPWQSTHLPVQDSDIRSPVGRIPRAVVTSPCVTTAEPVLQSPGQQLPKPALPRACTGPRRSCCSRKSALGKQRGAPLPTARATPEQHQRPSTAEREKESCEMIKRKKERKKHRLWGDFPGAPAVETYLAFHCWHVGSIPGRGAKMPRTWQPNTQNMKQKQYCNKFTKDF